MKEDKTEERKKQTNKQTKTIEICAEEKEKRK